MYPKISVIVPMYNASKTIRDCVDSILSSDYPELEVIVADDASTDDSVLKIASLPCRIIKLSRNSGPGIARNRGVEVAIGEIIAFTDADCCVPKDWLRNIAEYFSKNDIGAVTEGYSMPNNKGAIALFQFFDTCFRQRNISAFIDTCVTSNFACKKAIFLEIGGFPSQRINEDMEFGIALSRKCKIKWSKDNGVSHCFNNSLSHYFFEQILWSESVVKSYISDPKAITKKNTYNKSEIFIHLLLMGLMYLSLADAFLNSMSLLIFFSIVAIYFVINMGFMKFAARSKGYAFSLKLFPLLFIRNTAWQLGIIKAFLKHLAIMLRRTKLFNRSGY